MRIDEKARTTFKIACSGDDLSTSSWALDVFTQPRSTLLKNSVWRSDTARRAKFGKQRPERNQRLSTVLKQRFGHKMPERAYFPSFSTVSVIPGPLRTASMVRFSIQSS